MSDEEFEQLISEAIDSLPDEFTQKLEQVAITFQDFPTALQMHKLRLRPWTRLLGLHEGVSLNGRVSIYSSPLPDKVTIFKMPIISISGSTEEVKENVRSVVIHEIAHHFGFSEEQIRDAERRKVSVSKTS